MQEQIDQINDYTRRVLRLFLPLRHDNQPTRWDGGIVLPREEIRRTLMQRRRALAYVRESA